MLIQHSHHDHPICLCIPVTDVVICRSLQPEHSNVCFWYIPPSLSELPPGPDRNRRLHQVSPVTMRFSALINAVHSHCPEGCLFDLAPNFAGGPPDQSQDDGGRDHHGRLPALGLKRQLLPMRLLQSRHPAGRRGLSVGGDCSAWLQPMNVFFPRNVRALKSMFIIPLVCLR